MLRLPFLYLLLMNLLTYWLFRLDKRRAERGGHRIPERELLLVALAGGSPAALLATRRLRHKTHKPSFLWTLYGVVALQVVGGWYLLNA